MCYAVTCSKCGKTTWAGCGQHVDQVMRGIPKSQRCQCRTDKSESPARVFRRLFKR